MTRGPKKHLKRLNAPSHWMLDKLGGIFVSHLLARDVLKQYTQMDVFRIDSLCNTDELARLHTISILQWYWEAQ